MPRNIFVVGPQCAGKTTLIHELEKSEAMRCGISGPPVIIHEVVRDVMARHGLSSDDFGTSKWDELQTLTLEAQAHTEENAEKQWFISDRSALDALVYAQLQRDSWCKLRATEAWKACRHRMQDGLVILCEAGNMAWLQKDNARLTYSDGREWTALNERFQRLLSEEGIPYHFLPKDVARIEERVAFVTQKWLE